MVGAFTTTGMVIVELALFTYILDEFGFRVVTHGRMKETVQVYLIIASSLASTALAMFLRASYPSRLEKAGTRKPVIGIFSFILQFLGFMGHVDTLWQTGMYVQSVFQGEQGMSRLETDSFHLTEMVIGLYGKTKYCLNMNCRV